MKKSKKLAIKVVSLALAVLSGLSLVGCGLGKTEQVGSNSEKVLDIYLFNAGYGTDWVYALKDGFMNQEWVKSKYGDDLTVNITYNDLTTYATDHIKNGDSIDLYFGMNLRELYTEDYQRKPVCEDLTDLFDKTVPGTDIKLKDKLIPTMYDSCSFTDDRGNKKIYSLPWASSMTGIYYNHDLLKECGIDVPLTTEQLIKACDVVSEKQGFAVMASSTYAAYWAYLYSTFWAQYAGADEYNKYLEGKVGDDYAVDSKTLVESQPAMLKSLQELDKILKGKHMVDTANSMLFMTAQTNFLKGQGAFMACGDWFESEMKKEKEDRIAAGQSLPEISMMKTPIISSIVEKLEYRDGNAYMSDEKLAALIKDVDAGKETPTDTSVSQSDYDIVRKARGIVYSPGPGHNAIIPSYTPAKELAKDFLLYMSTSDAYATFFDKTEGAQLPFMYDAEKVCGDIYTKASDTAKIRNELYNNENEKFRANILPYEGSFPLVMYSGLGLLPGNTLTFEVFFGSQGSDYVSPDKLYEDAKKCWDKKRWTKMLEDAMLI